MNRKRRKSGLNFWEFISFISEKYSIGFIIGPLIILALTLLLIKFLSEKDTALSDSTKIIITLITASTAFAGLLFRFLANDKEKKNEDISTVVWRHQIAEREKNIESTIKEALTKNPELLNVEKTIYNKLITNLENTLINKLDERFKNNVKTEFISNSLINELIPLTKNVERYIDRIQRNSIVNLFIGILGTGTAITILAFTILTNKTFDDIQDFSIHFLPRFTFVIFIQIFAFFFLRLYKNNLEDAKYFQNELTNLTAKSSAIKISYLMGNTEKVYEMLKELSLLERNFKLLKDETTIGIEKAKLETDLDKSLLIQFKDLLSKYNSSK